MSDFKITYVPQPDFFTCDQACLAMVARISIEEAISVMGKEKGSGSSTLYKALKKLKIDYLSWRSVLSLEYLRPIHLRGELQII